MTPKCRILCPTFGGHITLPKSRLLLCDVGGAVLLAAPFVSLLYPISGALSIASRRCGRTILQKAAGERLRHIGLGLVCRKPCRNLRPGIPPGAPFLSRQEAPRRRHPAESPDRASDRTPQSRLRRASSPFRGAFFEADANHLPLCIKSLSAASGRGKIFQKTQKRS